MVKSRYEIFETAQLSAHHHLTKIVTRYLETNFLKPFPKHQNAAFASIKKFCQEINRPLILDSCCGTGHSSLKLSELYPDHGVVGIDKSMARLRRGRFYARDNLLLIQGDVIDLWQLCNQENLPIARHYLFYPNPWPKISHVKRRFHAHPIFKTMTALAPYFEMRTNWSIYAEECLHAFRILGHQPTLNLKKDSSYISMFEKKYVETACPIYVLVNDRTNY